MTGKVYVLNNGVFMMTLPRELRNKARLNEGDKLLFGVVKSSGEYYFIKNNVATGRLARKINYTNTNGALVTVPKVVAELLQLKHKDIVKFRVAKRVYITKEDNVTTLSQGV